MKERTTLLTTTAGVKTLDEHADHTAILTGNNKTGWVYQSKDGTKGFGGLYGTPEYTKATFSTSAAALQAASNLGYKSAEFHKASPQQDKQATSAFDKAAHTKYSFVNIDGGNCGDAVNKAITSQGIKYDSSKNPKSQLDWTHSNAGENSGWRKTQLPAPDGKHVLLQHVLP